MVGCWEENGKDLCDEKGDILGYAWVGGVCHFFLQKKKERYGLE